MQVLRSLQFYFLILHSLSDARFLTSDEVSTDDQHDRVFAVSGNTQLGDVQIYSGGQSTQNTITTTRSSLFEVFGVPHDPNYSEEIERRDEEERRKSDTRYELMRKGNAQGKSIYQLNYERQIAGMSRRRKQDEEHHNLMMKQLELQENLVEEIDEQVKKALKKQEATKDCWFASCPWKKINNFFFSGFIQ